MNNKNTDIDDFDWNKLIETLAQFPNVVDKVVKKYAQPELAAPFFDARAIDLPAGETLELFPYDASRIRFYLRAGTADNIQMGNRDQVSAGLGWVISTDSFTEFHTVAPITVMAIAPDKLYLWAEYRER